MPEPMVLPAVFGRYRLVRKLGEGGMGVVYLAEDTRLGRQVALKIPRFDAGTGRAILDRFLREARTAAVIRHPHVCPVHDIDEIDGIAYLTMPYIEGHTLASLIHVEGAWPVGRGCHLMRKVALAVQAIHDLGMVHRDLKPGNIVVQRDGEPMVMDFGLARSFTSDSQRMTSPGAMIGTPAYMAPEQVQGDADAVGPATDVYAVGVILYELLTGSLPFPGPGTALFAQILHAEVRPPSSRRLGCPPDLDAVCLKAMARQREARFASAAEFAAALAPFASAEPLPLPPPVPAATPADDRTSAAGETPGPIPELIAPETKAEPLIGTVPPAETAPEVRHDATAPVPLTPRRRQRWLVAAVVLVLVAGGGGWLLYRFLRPVPQPFVNSIGMKLVPIPAGRFQMGSPETEASRDDDEDLHVVEITRAFYMGAFEVTQEEYKEIMGRNPSSFAESGDEPTFRAVVRGRDTRRFPVETVSWDDANEFCRLLSARKEEWEAGRRYRLPTEAEWEYACRAGTTTPFAFGNALSSTQARFDGRYPYGGAAEGPIPRSTGDVGSYEPNAWGLYDMHGNVWEWCSDWYGDYPSGMVDDPTGPGTGRTRIIRGGFWAVPAFVCRSANRNSAAPNPWRGLGFRVVCTVAE